MVASSASPESLPGPPRHVAIIMDGNGRWAEQRGLRRSSGHEGGIEPVRATIRAAVASRIEALTLFAFSSENFSRPSDEVDRLMALFIESVERETDELDRNGVRIRFIGDRSQLAGPLLLAMRAAEEQTRNNSTLELVVAVAYGGRWDLVEAARYLANEAREGRLDPAAIDESVIEKCLATADLPPVDLMIRTGGEQRISNFLLWNLAYSELYFSDCLWPDFDQAEFERALEYFSSRQRRFGRTGRQIGLSAC